jgi:tetratricopeptide (TPR) repeat protein
MDEAKFKQYWDFTFQLLRAFDQEELTTLLRENCLLIDEDWIEVMKIVEQYLIENGDAEAAAWLQNVRQFSEQAINDWNQLSQTAIELYHQGKYAEAINFATKALEIVRTIWLGDHPNIATSLNNLAGFYCSQGRYKEAESLYQQALKLYKRLYKDNHPDVATSLNNLAVFYCSQGRYEEAEPLYQQALELYKRLDKDNHPDVATSLNNLADLYCSQGRYKEAEPLYRQALELFENLLGNSHPNVAQVLNNLAILYQNQGRYEEAEPLYRQALELFKRLFGDNHPDVAQVLNNLAILYRFQGRYEKAEPLHQQALELFENLLGNSHPNVAQVLNNLAILYQNQGRYEEAEPLYRQALELFKRLFGDNHPDVAQVLNNLAILYRFQGRYEKAEPLHQQALELCKCLLGDNHPDVATCLDNLAGLYRFQGRYEKAEPLLLQALDLRKRLLGDNHLNVTTSLNNLAELYQSQRRYEEAESLYQQALDLRKRLWRDNHPSVALSLNNLALLYSFQGRYEEIEPLLLQALELSKRLLGDNHPHVATCLNNLAELYQFQKRYEEAEPLYQQALELRKRFLGNNHPDVTTILNNLAGFYRSQGRYEEALVTFQEAVTVEQKITHRVFAFSSESDRLRHLNQIRITTDILLSLVVTHFSDNPTAIQIACDVVLQRKGLSAAAVAAFNAAIYQERYQHLSDSLQQWRSLNEQITYQTMKQATPQNREHLQRLQQQADQLEKDLASQVPEIQLQDQTVDRKTLAGRLPAGSLLLEFVRFNLWNEKNKQWGSSGYLVFILPAGQPDQVEMKALGEANRIDQLIADTRLSAIAYVNTADGKLKRFDGRGTLAFDDDLFDNLSSHPQDGYLPDAAIKLSQVILDPIRPYLADKRQIFISPDAGLSLLPFQLLPLDESAEDLLIDRYSIGYLSAGRDLLRSTVQTDRPASSPLIIADPKFALSESDLEFLATRSNTKTESKPYISTHESLISTLDLEDLERAATTGLLAQNVADLLKVEPHLQTDALTTHLTDARCPNILLIGTHGWYSSQTEEPPPEEPPPLTSGGVDLLSTLTQAPNPMLRSGLAFAGTQNWIQDDPLPPQAGKGFLFAQDIALLDLWANEVTVLCACQSAVGDTRSGEGVFGLRRAFAVAGAKTLVMSLWSVPEQASTLLVDRFFTNLLNGLGRRDALEEAQNYIRHITIAELRQSRLGLEILRKLMDDPSFSAQTPIQGQEGDHPLAHPYYWGAWICQGETDAITVPR